MAPKGDHDAPESASGVLFQFERALYYLSASSSEAIVGVEADDDVSVIEPGLPKVREQDKLSLQPTGHPFQDRGKGLWKTLRIWLKAHRDGGEKERTAELHLCTNRPIPTSAFVRMLGQPDKSADDLTACVNRLRELGREPSDTMRQLMTEVCEFGDDELRSVILRIRLHDASSGVADDALRKKTVDGLHIPQDVDAARVIQALLGWMHDVLRGLWRDGKPGWIARPAFDNQLNQVVRGERAIRKRERAEHLVPISEDQRAAAQSRPFVERLIEIDVEDESILRAIDWYLRFSAERFRLANEGDITNPEWDGFFGHLRERWSTIARKTRRNRPAGRPEDVGKEAYLATADDGYLAPLAGRPTEHSYLTSGAYQRLADDGQVHWRSAGEGGKGTGDVQA